MKWPDMVVEEKWIEGCGERESGDSARGKHEDLAVEDSQSSVVDSNEVFLLSYSTYIFQVSAFYWSIFINENY